MLEMKVPSPGESITEVEIAEWLVKDGDYVEKDQTIAEVDSDKATLELPAEEAGIITLKAEEGDVVDFNSQMPQLMEWRRLSRLIILNGDLNELDSKGLNFSFQQIKEPETLISYLVGLQNLTNWIIKTLEEKTILPKNKSYNFSLSIGYRNALKGEFENNAVGSLNAFVKGEIAELNDELQLNRQLDCDVDFGHSYAEIH